MSEKLKTKSQLSISGATDYAVTEMGDLSIYYGYEYKYCWSHGFNFEKHCECQGIDSLFIKYKKDIIFSLTKNQIEEASELKDRLDTPERFLISGFLIWLDKVGFEYIMELAKLTLDKKLEEIVAPKSLKTEKPKPKKVSPKPHILKDKVVVFSGFRDNLMERLIIQKGGAIANSVGYNTDYLVIPDELKRDITTKINKANRFGVDIKRRTQFTAILNS